MRAPRASGIFLPTPRSPYILCANPATAAALTNIPGFALYFDGGIESSSPAPLPHPPSLPAAAAPRSFYAAAGLFLIILRPFPLQYIY